MVVIWSSFSFVERSLSCLWPECAPHIWATLCNDLHEKDWADELIWIDTKREIGFGTVEIGSQKRGSRWSLDAKQFGMGVDTNGVCKGRNCVG